MSNCRLFITLVSSLLVAGCTGGLTDPFVGEWQGPEGRVLRLKEGGKAEYRSGGETRATGTYTRMSSKAATLELTSTGPPQPGVPSSRKQILRLDDAGRSFEFNRLRFRRKQ